MNLLFEQRVFRNTVFVHSVTEFKNGTPPFTLYYNRCLGCKKEKKERKDKIRPYTDRQKGKGMNIYFMLSIVKEVCPRIPKSMRKYPLNLLEEIRKKYSERTTLELRHK